VLANGEKCRRIKIVGNINCSVHFDPEPNLCSVCIEPIGSETTTLNICKHQFCTSCISNWVPYKPTCPMCRKEVTSNDYRSCCEYLVDKGKFTKITITYINLSKVLTSDLIIEFIAFFNKKYNFFIKYTYVEFLDIIEYIRSNQKFEIYASISSMSRSIKQIMHYSHADHENDQRDIYASLTCHGIVSCDFNNHSGKQFFVIESFNVNLDGMND